MEQMQYYSTNNADEKVNFETALLNGMASEYGLYMVARQDIPKIDSETIENMKDMTYAEIAFEVLYRYLYAEIEKEELKALLEDAYDENVIPTDIQHVIGKTSIMWLTKGPTYSFKDYAARFFARTLNYFLGKRNIRRVVVVATSGDTGGAVADALHGLDNVDNIVFFPKGSISPGQRRQMTTLGKNVYAFEVNGDFDVCQALAKHLLNDRDFAETLFNDKDRLTSANSISLGRALPQSVYPFYAYSRIAKKGEKLIASIPSGNFGDMLGTVLAKAMGLPIAKILCGVNENREFPNYLETGTYEVHASISSPSSAMIVSHPSNLARVIDFYGGHMYDERDPATGKVTRLGVIDKKPDITEMRKDIYSISIKNPQHYEATKEVYERFGIILDPHGAVGWKALDTYLEKTHDKTAVIYETADPGKFPDDVIKAIGVTPKTPSGIIKQAEMDERIYSIESAPDASETGQKLSDAQIDEAKQKITEIYS